MDHIEKHTYPITRIELRTRARTPRLHAGFTARIDVEQRAEGARFRGLRLEAPWGSWLKIYNAADLADMIALLEHAKGWLEAEGAWPRPAERTEGEDAGAGLS